MATSAPRGTFGRQLSIHEVLKRWADPSLLQAVRDLSDAEPFPKASSTNEYQERHERFKKCFEEAIELLVPKLIEGEFFTSGIRKFVGVREPINPQMWEMLDYDPYLNDAAGPGLEFSKIEFFSRDSIPDNIGKLPSWLRAPLFSSDSSYKHISLNGEQFTLGEQQSKIIKTLHQAYLAGDAWVNGKKLLSEAGVSSPKLRDLFKKNYKKLIESDERGEYRLRISR